MPANVPHAGLPRDIDYLIRPLQAHFRSEREPPLVTREPRQIDYSVGFQT